MDHRLLLGSLERVVRLVWGELQFPLVRWGSSTMQSVYHSTVVCVCVFVCESRSTMSDSLRPLWNSPGQNTGVGSLQFRRSQGIFPTQGSKPALPCCGRILYRLSHQSPEIMLAPGLLSAFPAPVLVQASLSLAGSCKSLWLAFLLASDCILHTLVSNCYHRDLTGTHWLPL